MARAPRHERTATLTQADGRTWVFSTMCARYEEPAYYTLDDIPGWYGGAGVKAEVPERARHGDFEMRGYREGRTMSIVGSVIATSQAACDEAQRDLSSILWSGEMGTLRVEESERVTLNSRVRLDGAPKVTRLDLTHLEFTIPIYSPESFLYADTQSAYSYPLDTGLGLVFPMFSGYLPPPAPPVEHSISASKTFTDLTDLFSTGEILTDGGATVQVSSDWSEDGTTSLRIGPGTSNSSAAYILPRYSAFEEWAGRLVTAEATVHLPERMPDGTVAAAKPARSISIGVDYLDGSAPLMDYASAPSPDRAAGTYPVKVQCLLPDDLTTFQGWFIRLMNGSTEVPVYWDAFTVTGEEVPRIEIADNTLLDVSPLRVTQSFGLDQVTGEFYAGQPRSAAEKPRTNLARNATFQSLRGCFGVGFIASEGGAGVSLSRDWSAEGPHTLKITPNGNTSAGATLMPRKGWEVMGQSIASGINLTVGLDMYLPEPQTGSLHGLARTFGVGFVYNDGSASTNDWSAPAPNVAGAHRLVLTVVTPEDFKGIYIYVRNGSATQPIYVDRLTIEGGITEGSWTPSYHEDEAPLERVNMLSNGSFEAGIDQRADAPIGKSSNAQQVVLDTAWKASGKQSIRIDPKTTGNGDSATYVLGTSNSDTKNLYGFVPGNTYTVSGTFRLATPQGGTITSNARGIRINTYDGSSITYGWAYSPQAPNAAGAYRLSVTFTVPESSAAPTGGLTISLYNGSSVTPAWWDDVAVEPGETDGSAGFVSGARYSSTSQTRTATDLAENGDTSLLGTILGESSKLSTTGGSEVELDSSWAPTVGGTSLRIGPGTYNGAGIYISNPYMPTTFLAGDLVTVTCKMRLAAPQTDDPESDGDHKVRALNVSARTQAGSNTGVRWAMNWSTSAPNTAGVHELSCTFLVPDEWSEYPEWAIRVVNGSETTPVWVSDFKVTARQTERARITASKTLELPGDRVMQGFDIDPVNGDIYTTQLMPASNTDLRVHRLSAAGELLETMLLPGGGHGGDMAIEHAADGTVWYWNHWPDAGGRVRVPFRAGTMLPDDPAIEYLWSTSYARFSVQGDKVTVRSATTNAAGASVARYSQFLLSEFLEGGATPIRYHEMTDRTPYAFQGFVATDEYIYEAGGGDKGDPTAIYRYTWGRPESMRVVRTTGMVPGSESSGEAEGIAMDPVTGEVVFGIATGPVGSRVATIFNAPREQWSELAMFLKPGAPVTEVGEDAYIYRLSPEGENLGAMLVIGGGHMNSLAVETDSAGRVWIWSQWDYHPDFGARYRWREGTLQWDDPDVEGMGIPGAGIIDYSLYGEELCVRTKLTGLGSTMPEGEYRVYDLADFKAGGRAVKRQLLGLDEVHHAFQGFAFNPSHLFVHHGGSRGDNIGIWRYSWNGSDLSRPVVMRTRGNWFVEGDTRNEAEGLAMRESTGNLLIGISGGPYQGRIASVQEADPAQFGYRDEWENGEQEPEEETTEGGVLTYGEKIQDPQATIVNGGRVDAHLVAIAYGDFPGGVTVTSNLGTGSLTYPWPVTLEAPLELYGKGEAWIGDTNVSHLLTQRDFSQLVVAPGETRSVFFDPLQGGTGYLQVDINEAYA